MKEITRLYSQAKKEGRICCRCGWMVSKKIWDMGFRLCAGCASALRGVNTPPRWGKWRDEPLDKTGEML